MNSNVLEINLDRGDAGLFFFSSLHYKATNCHGHNKKPKHAPSELCEVTGRLNHPIQLYVGSLLLSQHSPVLGIEFHFRESSGISLDRPTHKPHSNRVLCDDSDAVDLTRAKVPLNTYSHICPSRVRSYSGPT